MQLRMRLKIYFSLTMVALILSTVFITITMANDSTWNTIKKRGTFRVAAISYEPFFLKDPKSGKWQGMVVDMCDEIAKTTDLKVEYVETTWGNAIAALQANQLDAVFGLDATPPRAKTVDFILHPMLYLGIGVLSKDNLKIVNWEDLNNSQAKVGVVMGSAYDRMATKLLPNATINRYPSTNENIASFQSGRSDACVMTHMALSVFRHQIGNGRIVLPDPKKFTATSIAVRKESAKEWRDFLTYCAMYYYDTGKTQEWYEKALTRRGIDPKTSPSIMKELWK